ncbi:hypothetical protein PG990_001679 [Apiospora arundinis]|uniref:Uncharacterized protein n=1 Tax=Apiospora arundinis TaxID=335852 RepID=A0ABR2I364_9PEZI
MLAFIHQLRLRDQMDAIAKAFVPLLLLFCAAANPIMNVIAILMWTIMLATTCSAHLGPMLPQWLQQTV